MKDSALVEALANDEKLAIADKIFKGLSQKWNNSTSNYRQKLKGELRARGFVRGGNGVPNLLFLPLIHQLD